MSLEPIKKNSTACHIIRKRIFKQTLFLIISLFTFLYSQKSYSQACDASVPSLTIDLTGNPDSIWYSQDVVRDGLCCGNNKPDRCVEFWVKLDPGAEGINFDLASGAVPSGAMYYQVFCGPLVPVGQPLCVNGVGPYRITFCKPGNNQNTYKIISIAKPDVTGTVTVSDGCTNTISATGYQPSTVTWRSISPGIPGQYNSFLSCTSGCLSTTATYVVGAPASVVYEVCGIPVGGCSSTPVCNTTTVNFVSTLKTTIVPTNPTICFGGAATTLTATPTGGLPPYIYTWSNGASTKSISVNAPGTYTVQVRDNTSCPFATASVVVTAYSMPILAMAGSDITSCANNPAVTLSGSVQSATGGRWSNGAGTFSPNDSTLTATYTPSAAEITAGTAKLILTTTGNGTCPASKDTVLVNIAKTPIVNAGADVTVCGNNANVTLAGTVTNAGGGRWSGGTGSFFPNDSTLNAIYSPSATEITTGIVNLTLTSIKNGRCTAVSDQMKITITAAPTANAGVDQSVCANNPNVTLAGTATAASSFTWSGGGGTYNPNANTLNITYTPTAGEISSGSFTLKLTASRATCNPVTDNVVITVTPSPTANAGVDRNVCANNSGVVLNGSVTTATGGSWIGGTGTFNPNSTTLNATYTPSASEASVGSVTLTLLSTGNGTCLSASDQMTINISPAPTVNAGIDRTVCANNASLVLSGNVTIATGGTWSGGTGIFSPNANTLNATYTPSAAEILAGQANLILTSTGNGLCSPVLDQMKVTITVAPVVNAGPDLTVCANNPTIAINGSVVGATGGTWTGGAGTFSPNSPVTTYTPTATEISNGSVTLTLTSTGNGLCNPVLDQMTITITPAPTVNAGADQTVCANNSKATLNGIITIAGGGIWSGGSGTFTPNNTTLNATYKPTAAEITTGSVTLTLTSTVNGNCTPVSDQMKIFITTSPTVNAGPDQVSCANNPSVTLNGSKTIATGGVWSNGVGTFIPNNATLNPTYTPSASEISTGIAVLVLTTTGNGNCNAVTDTMSIIITPSPNANAGVDKTVCANNPAVNVTGTVSNASSFSWSGGSGTYTPNNASLNITYTPTASEISAGSVSLTLTSNRNGCISVTDQMNITITPSPTVNAGPDQTVCANNANITLAGSTTVATGGTWTGGSGAYNPNANTLTAIYTPSAAEITAGVVNLTLTTTGNGSCLAVQDQVKFNITPAPIVNAGVDQTVCSNKATVTLNGAVNIATGGTWSGGTGIFNPNANTLNANYTPSASEITAGGITLTLTSTGNGNCNPVTDQVRINITPAPVVNAGPDQSVCANNVVATLTGTVTVATGGIWTGGNGIYSPGNTSLNLNYTPGATEISSGTVTLTLTSTGNGSCNQVSDDVVLTITPAPTVNAGPDQAVCGNTAGVPLAGIVTVSTGGSWSTSGTGSFSPNANTLSATYVPSAADKTAGSITLTLTTTGNGKCTAINDQMTITFSSVPFANAGPDQIVCTNDFPVKLNGAGTSSSWVGGNGIFTPGRNVLNPTYTPTAAEVTSGSVNLTLVTTAIGACPSVSDAIAISLIVGPSVNAGSDITVCGDINSIAVVGSVLNAGGGKWTTTGMGSFNPNATTLNASYVPTASEKTGATITITLTSTGNGSCSPVSDDMILKITPAPTVNVGPDLTFCSDISTISLNANLTVATGGVWSGGTGTFSPNNTSTNITYKPTALEKASGNITLTFTTTGNGTCIPVSDNATITFTPAPTSLAGPDQTICADKASTLLSGTVTVASGGTWTTNGTGTFSPDNNTLNPSYFISLADTTAHTVRFILTTTGNGTCVAVKDTMLLTILPKPIANAGTDQTVCSDIAGVPLAGSIIHASGGQWSSTGTGSFSPNNTTLNASYVPTAADKTGGLVTLTLTSSGNGTCNAITDQMRIQFTPAPVVDAGPNQTICADNPVSPLLATETVATGVTWSSSGTGTFDNKNILNPKYTASAADTAAHSVILRVTTTGNGLCNPVKDSLTLTITPKPIVSAGPDQTVCGDVANITLNGKVINALGGTWSGGAGSFSPNSNTLNATYIPTASEKTGSSITLTLTSTGNGNCNPITDQVVINITTPPTVNAGPDQTVCADLGAVSLNGNVTIATGGAWATSGTGTFANASNTITTYTPSATDISNGTVVLTLTTTGTGTCNIINDQLILTITPAPTINAGPDKNICADQTSIALNGTSTVATGGTWTTSGTGGFNPGNNSLITNYLPSAADTAAKSVSLILTSTGNGTCKPVKDTMNITIRPVPVVDAGPDVTVCADIASVILNGASIHNATGGSWTSNGTGSFVPNAFTINATYVPSATDKSIGSVTLTLTSTGSGICSAISDQVKINITPAPTVNAGADQTVCATTAGVSLNGSITVATGGVWSTASGAGTFTPDPNTLNAVFIPAPSQIAAGKAILRLTTTGNGTCNSVTDDLIINITPAPTVDAGPNQTVCSNLSSVNLTGIVTNATGGTWISSGSGSFTNANLLTTSYVPSALDKIAGNVTLTLTSTGNGVCSSVSDNVTLGFQAIPAVDAGPVNTCTTIAGINLNGVVTNASGGRWTSTGTGSFSPSRNILNPKYTPSLADETAGSVILYLTTTGNGSCPSAKDSIMLGVQPNPLANAGIDQIVCADIGSVAMTGVVTNASGGNWTSSGGGSFSPASTNLNAAYNLSAVDIMNGSATITLTTTGNGFCPSASDQMIITITPAPTINAGADQTVCGDASGISINGNVTVSTGGTWTTTGTGTFAPGANNLSTTYKFSSADTASHFVRLKLTSTGNGTCKTIVDSLDITITPAPTVNIGSDITLCADAFAVAYTASKTIASGVTWTSTGSGSFDNTNTTTSQYTLSSTDKTNGTVKIIATTTGNGTCNAVKDTAIIFITPAPTVDAIAGNACADADTIKLNGIITIATGAQWTTSGTGSFVPDNITLNAGYIPSVADKASGLVKLILTTTGNGTCTPVADSVMLNLQPTPKTNAGPDQTICADAAGITLAGIVNNASGGVWTTLGSGTFVPGNTVLNGTYKPSIADTTAHKVTLVLTSTGNGFCSASVDTVKININPAIIVDAGPAVVCKNAGSVTLNGIIVHAAGGVWSTFGDGTFGNTTSLSTTYTPGPIDISNGSAVIRLTSNGNGLCNPAFDNMIINITNAPIANAGSDQILCSDKTSVTLAGSVTNAGGGIWSTPDGTGSFVSNISLSTNYNITSADTTRGTVSFILTTRFNGSCLPVTDTILVTLTDAPLVNAGPATVCSNAPPVALNGTVSSVASGGQWTTSGNGTFGNANNLITNYIPSATDNSNGSVKLTLTTIGTGTCNAVSDTITLLITGAPMATAGSDNTICADASGVLLSGTVSGATGGLWQTTGSGSFSPSASTLNATYVPSSADTTSHSIKLSLITTGVGACNPVTDTMNLTINPVPLINAGPDHSVCGDITSINLNGVAFHATGGQWSGIGTTGSFGNASNLITTYSPTTADTTAGKATFVLTSTGMGSCNAVNDTIVITITDAPSIDAKPDQLCSDAISIPLTSTKTVAGGVHWTTSGSGNFAPNDISLNTNYVPSAADRAIGFVDLTVTTTGNGTCNPVSDNVQITLKPAPIASAGADQGICADAGTITLTGTVTNAGGGNWSTLGNGTFANSNNLNTTYNMSSADTASLLLKIVLTTTGVAPCTPATDTIVIDITPAPVAIVNAGNDTTVCSDNPDIPLKGTIANAAGGMWTSTGSGIFTPNAFSMQAQYLPSAADVSAGTVTLTLESTGNGICNPIMDDMIVTITSRPTVNAGADGTVCADVTGIPLNAIPTTATQVKWFTSGSGSFDNDQSLTPIYKPSLADTTDGLVILTVQTIDNGACSAATDNVQYIITPAPTVNAGFDQIICADGDSIQLNGIVTVATGGTWSTLASGTFNNANNLNTYYKIAPADTAAGSITLTLTTTGTGTCNPVSDQIVITITDAPRINAGPDQTICADQPKINLSGFVTVAAGIQWISNGTGTYSPDDATINTSYFTSNADTAAHALQFIMTTTAIGTCSPVSDTLNLTINPVPVVNAGPDQTICADAGNTSLNGAVVNATGGTWTSSGSGSFPDPTILNATYVPSPTDTINGLIILNLHSTGNVLCNQVTDNLKIIITPKPIVNAGPDATVCADLDSIALNGSVWIATGGIWSTSGAGSFFPDATTLNAKYIPAPADKTAGSVSIRLTSTGNGTCNPVRDSLKLIILPAPIVNAGGNKVMCADAASIILNGTVTNALSGTWVSTGTGSFAPNANSPAATYVPSASDKTSGLIGLTLTSTGNGTCMAVTNNIKLTITPAPTVNAGSDISICEDASNIQLNGSKTIATGSVWTTSGSGSFNPNANALNARYVPSANDITAGAVDLKLTTLGNGTCQPVNDNLIVTFTTAPTVNAGPDQTLCANSGTISLNGTITISTGGTWSTLGTGSFSPNPNGLNRNYTLSAADTTARAVKIILTSTGNGTCKAKTDTVAITLQQVPIVSTGGANICADVTGINLSGSVINASGGMWSTAGSGTFSPNPSLLNARYNPSQADINAGFVVLQLTSQGNGTCNAISTNMNVTITPLPVANGGPDQRICRGTDAVLIAKTVNDVNYNWYTTKGINISTNGIANITANTDTSFVLTVTDAKGCTVNDTVDVFVVDPPALNLAKNYCFAFGTALDANPIPVPANGIYQWYRNDTLQAGENNSSIIVKVIGTHVISYNYGSCTIFDTTHVTPLPVLNGIDKYACVNTSTILSTSSIPGATYQWSTLAGAAVGTNNDSLTVTTSSTPWNSITYVATVTNNLGCQNKDTLSAIAVPPPTLTLTNIPSCEGSQIILNAEPSNISELLYGALTQYTWNKGSVLMADTTPTITVKTTGTYAVKFNIGECAAYDTSTVSFYPLPIISNVNEVIFCNDPTSNVISLDAGPGTKYQWLNTASPNDTMRVVTVDDPGYYFVNIYNQYNCFVKDSINAKEACPPRLFVPDAFTPDDKSKNFTFEIFGGHFSNFEIFIYSRWGEVIFHSKDPKDSWDGTYRGETMPVGVYPYIITYEGTDEGYTKKHIQEGSVTVIR